MQESDDGELSILRDVPIFGRALVRSLAAASGDEWLIGRWGQGVAKPGQTAAWLVLEVDDDTMEGVETALKSFDASF